MSDAPYHNWKDPMWPYVIWLMPILSSCLPLSSILVFILFYFRVFAFVVFLSYNVEESGCGWVSNTMYQKSFLYPLTFHPNKLTDLGLGPSRWEPLLLDFPKAPPYGNLSHILSHPHIIFYFGRVFCVSDAFSYTTSVDWFLCKTHNTCRRTQKGQVTCPGSSKWLLHKILLHTSVNSYALFYKFFQVIIHYQLWSYSHFIWKILYDTVTGYDLDKKN